MATATTVNVWRTEVRPVLEAGPPAGTSMAPKPITRSGFEIRHIVTSQIASM